MKLEDIMDEWDKDSKIDPIELSDESIKTGKLNAKYLRFLAESRLKAKKAWIDYKEKKEWKRRYFRGDFNNPEDLKRYNIQPYHGLSVNVEVEKVLDGDSELNNLLLRKEYYEEIVTFCEAVIKELHNRTYAIGNSIKWNIFQGGG